MQMWLPMSAFARFRLLTGVAARALRGQDSRCARKAGNLMTTGYAIMIRFGETIHSALPQDIPWFLPDHAIFFSVFYGVLIVIGVGLGYVLLRSLRDLRKGCADHSC
jgi:hypothetical protein